MVTIIPLLQCPVCVSKRYREPIHIIILPKRLPSLLQLLQCYNFYNVTIVTMLQLLQCAVCVSKSYREPIHIITFPTDGQHCLPTGLPRKLHIVKT